MDVLKCLKLSVCHTLFEWFKLISLWGFYVRLPCSGTNVLQTSISSFCWIFARYIFHVLVVYHQYLYQVYTDFTLESDRQVLDRPGRILLVLVANQYMYILSVSIAPFFLVDTVGILMVWASLLCWSVWVVSSVEGLMSAVCVCTQVVFSPTASLFAFHWSIRLAFLLLVEVRVITKLPNSEQSYKGKVKTHKYINRQNQSTTGKLWKP